MTKTGNMPENREEIRREKIRRCELALEVVKARQARVNTLQALVEAELAVLEHESRELEAAIKDAEQEARGE